MTARLRPVLPALALTILLGLAWTASDWANLSRLWLPDTDDVMRLQQIRDWIGGQGFADVSQHRLAGGLPMHWSRIGDLVPAALILLLRPFTGMATAEIAAVVAWPLIQFLALLVIVRDLAHRLASASAGTAMVLAALAYPASALFLPGRIDHHGLQLLLVLVQCRALLATPTGGAGVAAGGAVALGAAIGLETLPFAVVTGAVLLVEWLRGDGARLSGFGIALAVGLVLLIPLSGTGGACDTIAPLMPPAVAGGLALAALGRIDHHRPAFLVASATALAVLAWPAARPCLAGPYATVDPLVARLWLARVGEAQPLFAAAPAQAIGYVGLLVAGLAATVRLARRDGGGWWRLLPYQATAMAIALAQLRGAHVGAALAVLPVAALLADARARGRTAAVLGLWIAGSGLSYPLAAGWLAPKQVLATAPDCGGPGTIDRLARLPTGRVMAGIDLGAYAIAGTRHSVVAAPYHRNNAGNAAMYRFYLGTPEQAARIADAWRIDYVVVCPSALGSVRSLAGSIGSGRIPAWLRPVAPAIYAVVR